MLHAEFMLKLITFFKLSKILSNKSPIKLRLLTWKQALCIVLTLYPAQIECSKDQIITSRAVCAAARRPRGKLSSPALVDSSQNPKSLKQQDSRVLNDCSGSGPAYKLITAFPTETHTSQQIKQAPWPTH